MKINDMKKAYIENILLWIVMFIGFVTLFFFVLNYAKIARVKDNMDAISDYGARLISTNGIGAITINTFVTRANNIAVNGIAQISSGNVVCNIDNTIVPPNYQVIFTTQLDSGVSFYNKQIVSRRAVFNESGPGTVTCTLTITYSE
ncbi:hypothetical protein [Halarcobacter sp.]|uniref:hypothetical protein n=1 Tax=Halarcobacter sp. TaxID=2321133 RepID=UPI0029F5C008|nr:hypothetical protein [Halarcobacter sp.]